MSNARKKWLMAAAVITVLALPGRISAQGGVEGAASCVNKEADKYVACVTDAPWWIDQLCLLVYEANAVLCVRALVT